ncbi:hypothetical protein [Sinomonas halotolerans]|uniref:Uncharacterized protein n=1 Tax=Sinomonas halotolerans TaxID=1644133 RepID=A0ABU9X4R3_9MICC
MQRRPSLRSRMAALSRHAAGAAGLGFLWLLLSGAPATALGDLAELPDAPASSLLAAPLGAASPTSDAVADAAAAEPLLAPVAEPIEAAVPLVESAVGGAAGAVGNAVDDVADLASSATEALPLAEVPILPEVLPEPLPTVQLPTPEAPAALPALDAEAPAAAAGPAPDAPVQAAAPASEWNAASSLALLSKAAMDHAVAEAQAFLGSGTPGGPASPGGPWTVFPAWAGASGAFGPAGPLLSLPLALAAGGLMMALLLRPGPRGAPGAWRLPGSPAFGPGCTPD